MLLYPSPFSLPSLPFFPYLLYPLFTKESSRLNDIYFSKIVITSMELNQQLSNLYSDLVFGELTSLTSIVHAKNYLYKSKKFLPHLLQFYRFLLLDLLQISSNIFVSLSVLILIPYLDI